jgi:hypothetical protein
MRKSGYIALISFFWLSISFAEETLKFDKELEVPLRLNFEELIFVCIASNIQESLKDTADSFTVITAQDINRYGYRHLRDEDIFFLSINRKTVNSIPHHMGRDFYANVSIDF